MTRTRVGVIGLGAGRAHIAGYQTHPDAEVVAIADLDESRLAEIGDRFGTSRRYSSGEEMLQEETLDVVSVATPNGLHKPLTIRALQAGCHVLCEKPMAMNAEEAREMLAVSRQTGKRVMINFSFRFNHQSMALKQQVDSGAIGDVYFARTSWHRRRGIPRSGSWFCRKELSGGGPLIDLGVHRLDLALWLMGYPRPTWVMASTYDAIAPQLPHRQEYSVEDLAVGLVRFENGATVELEASWAGNIAERELMETRLWGTKGGLVQRNVGEGYDFEAELYLDKGGFPFDAKLHSLEERKLSAMYSFVDSIRRGTPHLATAEEGLMVMEILDAMYRSAELGRPVEVSGRHSTDPG